MVRFTCQVKFQVNLSYHMFSEDLCYPQQISKLQEAESCSKPKWKQNCKKHCPVTVPSECFKWMFTGVCFNSMAISFKKRFPVSVLKYLLAAWFKFQVKVPSECLEVSFNCMFQVSSECSSEYFQVNLFKSRFKWICALPSLQQVSHSIPFSTPHWQVVRLQGHHIALPLLLLLLQPSA